MEELKKLYIKEGMQFILLLLDSETINRIERVVKHRIESRPDTTLKEEMELMLEIIETTKTKTENG